MSDIVTTQKLLDEARNLVFKFTNFSDGTGENLVKKIDVTTLIPPLTIPWTHMKLWSYAYDIKNMNVRIFWEGTPNIDMIILGGFANTVDMGPLSGIWNNAPQATGNILLSTNGASVGSSYTIILHFKKGMGTVSG